MRDLAGERRRFGYRRIGLMLEREGIRMNHKKLRRLYSEEGLQVKRRRGRKRAQGTRAPMPVPSGSNQRWSLDFVSDVFGVGRRFRILAVIDDFSRECLGLIADTSLPGSRVARELDAMVARRGKPKTIVSDNGSELTSRAILKWQNDHDVAWHDIAPGKPQQNGFIEAFNGRLRDELLNEEVFETLGEARAMRALAARLQPCATAFGACRPTASVADKRRLGSHQGDGHPPLSDRRRPSLQVRATAAPRGWLTRPPSCSKAARRLHLTQTNRY
jgi:putative transposase